MERLVDLILDSGKTRPGTVEALRNWAFWGSFPEVLAAVRPRLDDEERALLDAAASDD
jgi:hypothetical protein